MINCNERKTLKMAMDTRKTMPQVVMEQQQQLQQPHKKRGNQKKVEQVA